MGYLYMLYYAGIGARKTPKYIQEYMIKLAYELSEVGLRVRHGHADGADTAFMIGSGNNNDGYLPWRGFNRRVGIINDFDRTYEIAKRIRPEISSYREATKKLYSRNISQILGNVREPKSLFVVCWTENGKDVGGTGFALEVARCYGVKIFNYGAYNDPEELRLDVLNYLIKYGEENGKD